MTSVSSGVTAGTPKPELGVRQIVLVVVIGLLGAVAGFGIASVGLMFRQQQYRAEMQLALLPGPTVPPQELADAWEALNRGQAARIAAEVLGQRRWRAAAAQSAGVPAESIKVTAGAVADTSLIDLGVTANSSQAAEQAGESLVREARPVVEEVSGLFILEILQPAEGTAEPIGTSPSQLLAVASVAGLLLGSSGTLLVIRYRGARRITSVPHRDARPPDPFPDHYPDERLIPGGHLSGGHPSGGYPSGGHPSGGVPNGVPLPYRVPPWPGSTPTAPPAPPSTSIPPRR